MATWKFTLSLAERHYKYLCKMCAVLVLGLYLSTRHFVCTINAPLICDNKYTVLLLNNLVVAVTLKDINFTFNVLIRLDTHTHPSSYINANYDSYHQDIHAFNRFIIDTVTHFRDMVKMKCSFINGLFMVIIYRNAYNVY